MNKRGWKEKYDQAHRALVVAEDTIDVCESEHGGLAQAYRDILAENRTLWQDWEDEHALTGKLQRRIAKLKKRLAGKRAEDESQSTSQG